MEQRRYRLPYEDPGQRRPWVPYHEWVARREAERIRVPGVLRNDRAYYAQRNREYPVPRAEMRRAQQRAQDARMDEQLMEEEARRENYRENLQRRRAKWRAMHAAAGDVYDVGAKRGMYRVHPTQEAAFDRMHGDYGGRFEEFIFTGDEEPPEEAVKRLLEDDVHNLPVIDPKRIKLAED